MVVLFLAVEAIDIKQDSGSWFTSFVLFISIKIYSSPVLVDIGNDTH